MFTEVAPCRGMNNLTGTRHFNKNSVQIKLLKNVLYAKTYNLQVLLHHTMRECHYLAVTDESTTLKKKTTID